MRRQQPGPLYAEPIHPHLLHRTKPRGWAENAVHEGEQPNEPVVRVPGSRPLVTQLYVRGAPENQWDWLLNGVSDDAARERLIVGFEPSDDPRTAQLEARFDIVLA